MESKVTSLAIECAHGVIYLMISGTAMNSVGVSC